MNLSLHCLSEEGRKAVQVKLEGLSPRSPKKEKNDTSLNKLEDARFFGHLGILKAPLIILPAISQHECYQSK